MPIITDEAEIKELQEKFEKKFSANTSKIPNIIIGQRGYSGYEDEDVLYSESLDMWFCFSKHTLNGNYGTPRYWNAFGLGKPKQDSSNDIICEINFTKEGSDRSFFFVDESGKVFVYHNGRFTSHKGMSIDFFLENYKYKDKIEKIAGRKVVLVGILDSDNFANEVKSFVSEVDIIKKLTKSKP